MGRGVAVVLFTDLVGSTELRGRLGEEATEELRRKHDRLLTEAVEVNSGRVVKGLGDGIMATFAGASDAVAAAVAIQQAVDRLNRSGKAAVPLAVRVGLSAGDVTFEDDDVHGTPVIEAARLCAAAAGGEILASEVVRLLAGLVDEQVTDRGLLELKGLAKAVSAWAVPWEPAAASSIPMPPLLTDVGRVFVGRDAEVERLGQLWKEAVAGERRVALLAGEPGVGKTRLAAELAAQVYEQGAIVLAGRCDEDLGVPYQPFVEGLRHYVDHAPEVRLGRYGGELVRLVPELAERGSDLAPPIRSDPETERYRLFDAVAAWLASADEPLLLVLDDLGWAAKPTLLLLRHIVRSPIRHLLVLGTYRDTELTHDHPLVEVIADLRREAGVERFSLSGLDDLGVAAILEQTAGRALDEAGVALARAIYEETEGNPFFVREVLRHLAETGAVEQREGGWATVVAVEQLSIPEGVRDVVGRRLSRLSSDTNQALRVAAVVGSEFEVGVAQAAVGLGEEALLTALEEAAGARLVTEASSTRYRFSHALVRATLYDSLTAARQVALHRRVAEAIEAVHEGALDDHLPALAHHWARASTPAADAARAVDYARRAGDRALSQLANDEAAAYYQQALELLSALSGPFDEPRRLELLLALGEAQRRAGEPAHRENLLLAGRLAQARGDSMALARAALAHYRGLWSATGAVDAERVEVLEAALQSAYRGPSQVRARLLANLASELQFSRDWARIRALSDEALAVARQLADPATLAHVVHARCSAIWNASTSAERLSNTGDVLAVADQVDDPAALVLTLLFRYLAAMELGDVDEANRCLDRVIAGSIELGQPVLRWLAATIHAGRVLLGGRIAEAESLAIEAREIGRAASQPDARLFFGTQRFQIRFEQGQLAKVIPRLEEAVELGGTFQTQALLSLAYCEIDNDAGARRAFEPLAASLAHLPLDVEWLFIVTTSAAVCAYLGDERTAASLVEMLVPYGARLVSQGVVWTGSVAHYLGVLGTILHSASAESDFAVAQATHERVGAPCWLARTRLEWARMLLTRRQAGDGDRARQLLGQALATARELGLAKVERDAVTLLQDCP